MAYTPRPADNEAIANLPGDIRAVTDLVTGHTEAAAAAHEASAISYDGATVEEALDTAAGHQANQNNPHGVTAAQVGAVALGDAVVTVTANKVVRRDGNGKIAGDITGNAATATTATKLQTARTISLTGAVTGSAAFDGSANASIATAVNPWGASASFSASGHGNATMGSNLAAPGGTGGINTLNIAAGLGAGAYTLQSVIQQLVTLSHAHSVGWVKMSNSNCNCNCSDDNSFS